MAGIDDLIPISKRIALNKAAQKNILMNKVVSVIYAGKRKQIYVRELYEFYKETNSITACSEKFKVSPNTIRKIFLSCFIPLKHYNYDESAKMNWREIAQDIVNNREWPVAQEIVSKYKISPAHAYRVIKLVNTMYEELSKSNIELLKIFKTIRSIR